MRVRSRQRGRRGAAVVEFALVSSLLSFLLLGMVVFALGVLRYQQVSWLAREGARWAAVHVAQYAKDTGATAAKGSDVFSQAIVPRAVALDPSLLTCTVTWNKDNRIFDYNPFTGVSTGNAVTVTLGYRWTPE